MRERTLLQALMERRNLTRDQTVDALERRARTMEVASFSLTTRQLDRLLAGDLKGRPRSSTSAVLEEEFGFRSRSCSPRPITSCSPTTGA